MKNATRKFSPDMSDLQILNMAIVNLNQAARSGADWEAARNQIGEIADELIGGQLTALATALALYNSQIVDRVEGA